MASDPTQGDEDPTKHRWAEQLYAGYLVCLGAAIAEDKQTTPSDNVNKPNKMMRHKEVKIIIRFPQRRLPKETWCR